MATAARRLQLSLAVLLAVAICNCESRSLHIRYEIEAEDPTGWYVVAEEQFDGQDMETTGGTMRVQFGNARCVKLKGRPISKQWNKIIFIDITNNKIINHIDQMQSSNIAYKMIAHKSDGSIWYYIGSPNQIRTIPKQTVRIGDFVFDYQ